MITGFNTDVDYDGRVFHVQTEDRGRANPVVESHVYCGGEILTTQRTGYPELAQSADYSEEQVVKIMEAQHQTLVRDIQNGRLDPDGPKPVGYNVITNRSLDQVVLDFLSETEDVERIRLEIENHQVFVEGSRPEVKLRVLSESSEQAVPSIRVTVKLISTAERPREIFSGMTDADGRIEAALVIPRLEGADAAILFQAEAPGQRSEFKQLICPAGSD